MAFMVWSGFVVLILALLAIDLGFFHRKSKVIGIRESIVWSIVWIALALAFNVLIFFLYEYNWLGVGVTVGHAQAGREAAGAFFQGYVIEKSLSTDNIFVIAMLFAFFGVPPANQYRVLFWGIVGALVMRGGMIALANLLTHFSWVNYLFGTLLIITAIKMLRAGDEQVAPDRNPLVRVARRFFPVTPDFHGSRFFVVEGGKRHATPLFIALLAIESTDLLFAIDSIPAVFAVTYDPFLVFTSNVFAILGLRALYFALAAMMDMFRYLKQAIIVLLAYVGAKMLLQKVVEIDANLSLIIVCAILSAGVVASLLKTQVEALQAAAASIPLAEMGLAAWRPVRKLLVLLVGGTVVLIGVVLFFTPGPATVVIPVGLAILATEFVWARRLLNKLKETALRAASAVTGRSSDRAPAKPANHRDAVEEPADRDKR